MGLQIEGGTGNGYSVGVNEQNQLLTQATVVTKEHEINHTDGQSYSIPISVTPFTGVTCFLYLKNDNDLDIIIHEIGVSSASDETFIMKLNDGGTPVGGTTVTPGNRNAGSGNQADATIQSGENITGLSGGNTVFGVFTKGGESTWYIGGGSGLVVPKNKTLTIYTATGGSLISFGVGMTFSPHH